MYKEMHTYENYLSQLPASLAIYLCQFRLGSHKLPTEIGRLTGIPKTERKCQLCANNDLGDEYHYFFVAISLKRPEHVFCQIILLKI